MTISEFERQRAGRHCRDCGAADIGTELNPNNNGLLVICGACGSKRPWGSLLYLKQSERKRTRPPLPNGETLDTVWGRFGDRCVICSASKDALKILGIGRQVHHVLPYAQAGHQGPIVPICTHCHPVVSDRQRIYWFIQRVVSRPAEENDTQVPPTDEKVAIQCD
jgi:hypothetical protein